MYLRSLHLRDVKLIADLTLDFSEGKEHRPWTLLVGPNGTCKTTILQTIALLASGGTRALTLATSGRTNLVASLRPLMTNRSSGGGSGSVLMEATFSFGAMGRKYGREYPGLAASGQAAARLRSTLRIPPDSDRIVAESGWVGRPPREPSDPLDELRTRRVVVPHWFVAAYGVNRNLPRSGRPDLGTDVVDRVLSLFDGRDLVATSFADAFKLQDAAALGERYQEILSQVLSHRTLLPWVENALLPSTPETSVNGSRSRIDGRERSGVPSVGEANVPGHRVMVRHGDGEPFELPAIWLSQGYQSSIAWIADLVGWVLREAGEAVDTREMEGLVLIDEIDLHLHPTWQQGLVQALREVFPRLQFIATTHSPMVLPALGSHEIIRLDIAGGRVVQVPFETSPWQMTATELYRNIFGIEQVYPSKIGQDAWDYAEIATNPLRSDLEEAEMTKLARRLSKQGVKLALEPVPRESE